MRDDYYIYCHVCSQELFYIGEIGFTGGWKNIGYFLVICTPCSNKNNVFVNEEKVSKVIPFMEDV